MDKAILGSLFTSLIKTANKLVMFGFTAHCK